MRPASSYRGREHRRDRNPPPTNRRDTVRWFGWGVLLALLLSSAPSWGAGGSNRVETEHVRARLFADVAGVAPYSRFWVGLRFEIKPGWHTYWLNPGDSGLAASIDWELPEGMVAGDIRWPVPQRFRTGHLMSFGYADEVVLLTRMSAWPTALTKPEIDMVANVRWLVCEDICVQETGRFELSIPMTGGVPAPDPVGGSHISKYLRQLPLPAVGAPSFSAAGDTIRLRVPFPDDWPANAGDIWFYPEQFGIVDHAATQEAAIEDDAVIVTLKRGDLKHLSLERLRGVLVLRYRDAGARGIAVDAKPG